MLQEYLGGRKGKSGASASPLCPVEVALHFSPLPTKGAVGLVPLAELAEPPWSLW